MDMVELYPSPWRSVLERLLVSVERDLLISAPYIKAQEARWVCDTLMKRAKGSLLRLQVLSDVRSESVLSGSLDIAALQIFADTLPNTAVFNLPRLHAKAYLADDTLAIVGSANLTSAGLDANYEYNIGLTDPLMVRRIRSDFENYARVGNVLTRDVLDELAQVGQELSVEYQKLQRSASVKLRRRFDERLRKANYEFLSAQVGTRTAHSLFAEAMVYLLRNGPFSTRDLHPRIQTLLPDLCDDTVELVINGQHFGKRWKHTVRTAQIFLRRSGVIELNSGRWNLVQSKH